MFVDDLCSRIEAAAPPRLGVAQFWGSAVFWVWEYLDLRVKTGGGKERSASRKSWSPEASAIKAGCTPPLGFRTGRLKLLVPCPFGHRRWSF
ncbi:unnamed protein product [Linum trigynum]|uniref:Uncharacterized protein n=1 Tax=Linum trigynum TaxID=586398 RepID=A0AAV2FQF9_9ROSI